MRKFVKELICFFILTGILSLYFVPLLANAQPPTVVSSQDDIERILRNVRNIIWAILGFVVVIMFIWAGITFVTAEGDPGKTEKAKGGKGRGGGAKIGAKN